MSGIGVCPLGGLAEVWLGTKTFLNDFFYVDHERIEQFGIERRYLQPVVRTGDLSAYKNRFRHRSRDAKMQLFHCDDDLASIVGTGAAAYIKWGEKQRHSDRGDKRGELWPETPALRKMKRWYRNSSLPPRARIAMLKLINDQYQPYVLDDPARIDQSFNLIKARRDVDEDVLIGLLCSTWFGMTLETLGRTAMGQGALQIPTEDLKTYEVPDIRNLSAAQTKKWKHATAEVLKGPRLPIHDLNSSPAQRLLDGCVLQALGLDESRVDELYQDTERMARVRKLLAQRGQIRREKFEADLTTVAADIAHHVRPLLRNRRFPNDFIPTGSAVRTVQLGDAPIHLDSELMLGRRTVTVSSDRGGVAIWEDDLSEPVAEVFIRAVQLGQRDFEVPADEERAHATIREFDRTMHELDVKLAELTAAQGASAAELREHAERELNWPVTDLTAPIPPAYRAEH